MVGVLKVVLECDVNLRSSEHTSHALNTNQCACLIQFNTVATCRCLVTILTSAVPNIPNGSVFIVIVICNALGLPLHDQLGQLFAVDWFLSVNKLSLSLSLSVIR